MHFIDIGELVIKFYTDITWYTCYKIVGEVIIKLENSSCKSI